MDDREASQENRIQFKAVLAIGLTVVFAAVVVVQVRSYWPEAEASGSERSDGSPADGLDVERLGLAGVKRVVSDDEAGDRQWPVFLLSDFTEYDPFATPAGFMLKQDKPVRAESEIEVLQTEIELARKRAAQDRVISVLCDAGVNTILTGGDQSSAIVGTRMIRVGEEIEGFRVLAIETDGIVIERPSVR